MTDKEYKLKLKELSDMCEEGLRIADENEKVINEAIQIAEEALKKVV